jgi:hypothetical protein
MTSIKLIALCLLLGSSAAQASMYRWVDEAGKVHFSDKVPPAMAQKGHTSLSNNGLTSEQVSSADDLRKKHAEELEKREAHAEMTEAQALEEEQRKKDEQLMATYASRDEIISAYSKKLSLIDQSFGILTARDESLTQKVLSLKRQYKSTKDQLTRDNLLMQVTNAQGSLADYRKAATENRAERDVISGEYRENLIRFDKLAKQSR